MPVNTLIELLQQRKDSVDRGVTFIEGTNREEFLSYGELFHEASTTLSYLQAKGLQPRNQVLFQVDDNKNFLILFWACLLGHIIPVPVSVGANDEHKLKLFNIWPLLNQPYLAISRSGFEKISSFAQHETTGNIYRQMAGHLILTDEINSSHGEGNIMPVEPDDIAFLQFSSGSTGNPKGVVLSHRNLITNLADIETANAYTPDDAKLSWMPLTHDMGMIGFHLSPMYCRLNHYIISTAAFIRKPSLWLEKANEHKATVLCSPNFGYRYLLKHWDFKGTEHVDLSHVRFLFNGAEPISEEICRNFLEKMQPYGLNPQCMCPVYGLAEASLAVSLSGPGDEFSIVYADRSKMNRGDRIEDIGPGKNAIGIVKVGKPVSNCAVRIANEKDKIVGDEIIGQVQIKGGNVTRGYYNNEAETQNAFTKDGWLRTGDLGFLKNGWVYITGRIKDIIFVNGQNIYPHDIERIAEETASIELNKMAVGGFLNHETQQEEIIAFVFHRGTLEEFVQLAISIKVGINSRAGIELNRIIPVTDIPRTTSGKLQRYKLIERYQNGEFAAVEKELYRLSECHAPGTTVPPGNEREEKLLAIWLKVLQHEPIGVTERFFDIGGNSLKLAEMSMLVWKTFGVELTVELLSRSQTIRELAAEIDRLPANAYKPIPVVGDRHHYPVTGACSRLFYTWQLDKQSTAYNTPVAFRVHGDTEQLTTCLLQLLQRHDALRMSFHWANGAPSCTVQDTVILDLPVEAVEEEKLDEVLRASVQPFDLSTAPLLRAKLFRVIQHEHILFLDFHHIITDGISVYNFINELMALYAGNELPALPARYRDYLLWQQNNATVMGQEKYWLEHLRGDLPALEMPINFSRPAIFSPVGEKSAFKFAGETLASLKQLARQHGCTLHAILFTAYTILLSKYSGQQEIIIGVPASVRKHPDLQHMHGMFVNNLVIRSYIDNDETFLEFLQRQKNNINAAIKNQDYGFDELVKKIAPKPNVSRSPFFDTMFIYQNMGAPPIHGSFSLSRYFFDPGFSKFDISIEVFEEDENLEYYFEYATALFARETIMRIAAHFENLLKKITGKPATRISELSVLGNEEYSAYTGKPPYVKSFPESTIHQLFSEQVQRTPDNVALEYRDVRLTYRQLNTKAESLAAYLKQKGIDSNKAVALLMRRSPELVISILGVLKAGGYYVPVDPDLPEERIQLILTESQCSLVIRQQDVDQALQHDTPAWTEDCCAPHDLAYVLYTSGTTGKPKGVMIEHASLVNYICWAATQYIQNEIVAFPLFTSIAFDLTVTSIFTPLVTGNTMVIYDDNGRSLPINTVINDNACEVIKLTPSHLKIIKESYSAETLAKSRIRRFIVGGEELTTALANAIYELFGGRVEIFNEYGPTETTVGCMIHRFNPEEKFTTVPIGIPAANTSIYILDEFLQPVPADVYGEIYISGEGVARGYLFNEALTAQKFVSDPFWPGRRMYRSGDIGRRLPGEILEFRGRRDQQVKINGYRVELSEIEDVIETFGGINQAMVALRLNKSGKQSLYAWYTGNTGIDANALRQYVASRLPYYMIPAQFARIEMIPLTQNGKTDYAALPVPIETEDPVAHGSPDETQLLLLKVWREVLGEETISITDNFFEWGGDSIKAVQVASRLYEQGLILHTRDILTYHSIARLSPLVEHSKPLREYEQGIVVGEIAWTPISRWFFALPLKNRGYYNQSVLLQFNRDVNISLLEKAFILLVRHHDGLRINYDPHKNQLFYNNDHLNRQFSIEIFANNEIISFTELKNGFDISCSLLIKAVMIGKKLLITAHHLVTDGISWRILLEDLHIVYEALEKNEPVKLPQKTASLSLWANALQQLVTDIPQQPDPTEFFIPQDFATDDWRMVGAAKISGALNSLYTGFLLKGSQRVFKTGLPVLLNTALAMTLKKWTGLDRFIIEQEGHGRYLEEIDVSRTSGWFTTLYLQQLELKDDNIGNQLRSVREQIGQNHTQGPGFASCFSTSMPAIRFNYLGSFDKEVNNGLFSFCHESTGPDSDLENPLTAKLEFNLMIVGGALMLDILYNTKAHKASTITWLKDLFLENLLQILDYLANEKEVHFIPSDFDAVVLKQEELDALFG